MVDVAIGVGSNRGDRAAYLAEAEHRLTADGRVTLLAAAPLIATAPVGGPAGQGAFLNGAWLVRTDLGLHSLLRRCRRIEDGLGRVRSITDGPRTIDLDLLLTSDARVVDSAVLTLPHPRLHLRRFVLEPLAAVAAAWRHPTLGVTIAELYTCLMQGDPEAIERSAAKR